MDRSWCGSLCYAFFVLASVATLRSRRSVLREMSAAWGASRVARKILRNADKFLLATQIGILLAGLAAGAILMRLLRVSDPFLERFLFEQGFGGFAVAAFEVGVLVLVVVFALTLIQLAKALGYAASEQVLTLLSLPLIFVGWVVYPLIFLLQEILGALFRLAGVTAPIERLVVMSAEDLSEVVQKSSEAGVLEDDEREFIEGVFSLGETRLSEVMTPRKDIFLLKPRIH